MNFIVVIIGWLIILEGLFGIARPHALIDMVVGWPSAPRFYFSVIVRVVLGILFLFAAPRCRVPWLIYVLGIFVLLVGIVLFFLGAARLDEIVNWYAARSELCIRLSYAVATLFGVILVSRDQNADESAVVDLISDALPFDRLWYGEPVNVYSRSYQAVIRVYDEAGHMIQTHEHKGEFKVW